MAMDPNYDINTDYQALIDQDVANGDLASAARHEAQRNAKISGMELPYKKTNNYNTPDNMSSYRAKKNSNSDLSPYYRANTSGVNSMYDADQQSRLAALQNAYNSNIAAQQALRAKIPQTYQAQANNVAANSAIQQAAFNERAAASGLNSGAGGQAALAQGNVLQGGLTTIRTNEANALTDADNKIAQMKEQYQNAVQQAMSQNAYDRAAALMKEFQMQQQSSIDAQREQRQYDFQQRVYNDSEARADKATARSDAMLSMQRGIMPSYDLLEAAGIPWQTANDWTYEFKRQLSKQ